MQTGDAYLSGFRNSQCWNGAAAEKLSFHKPTASVGIRGTDLVPIDTAIQINLFEDPVRRIKRERLEVTMDDLRRRFGHDCLVRTCAMRDAALGMIDAKANHIIHPTGYFKAI